MTSLFFSTSAFVYLTEGKFSIRKKFDYFVIVVHVWNNEFIQLEKGTLEECQDLFYDVISEYCTAESEIY